MWLSHWTHTAGVQGIGSSHHRASCANRREAAPAVNGGARQRRRSRTKSGSRCEQSGHLVGGFPARRRRRAGRAEPARRCRGQGVGHGAGRGQRREEHASCCGAPQLGQGRIVIARDHSLARRKSFLLFGFSWGDRILQEHHDQCSVMHHLLREEIRSNYVQLRFVTIYNQQISSRSAKARAWVHNFTYMSSYFNFERNYICYSILTRTEFEIFTPANVKLIYSSTHYNRVTLKHAAYIIFIFSSQSMRVSRFFFLFKLGPYPCVATGDKK